MNKKVLGASVRRGVLTGTVAGFVAGWLAFVGHGKQIDAAQLDASNEVQQKTADLVLPAIPGLPKLPPVPGAQSYPLRYGPAGPLPRFTIADGRGTSPASAATIAPSAPRVVSPVAAPPAAPVPTFAPLPALPPAPAVPAPTTRSSPHK